MFDDILPYYNSELRFMREMARSFAEANPKIAGNLRISGDQVDDPHVGRLIEGFAFLNARTRMKLDDDFPELTTALLDLLHPHYLRPFPSMGILELAPQAGLILTRKSNRLARTGDDLLKLLGSARSATAKAGTLES